MQTAILQTPFVTLKFKEFDLPIYGSRKSALFPVTALTNITDDPNLRTYAKKKEGDEQQAHVVWVDVVTSRRDANPRIPMFTWEGILKYAFSRRKPVEGFTDWLLCLYREFMREDSQEAGETPQATEHREAVQELEQLRRENAELREKLGRLKDLADSYGQKFFAEFH